MSQAILRAPQPGGAGFHPPEDSARFIQYAMGAALLLALLAVFADAGEPAPAPEVESHVTSPRERRILFFSARWCGPCRAVKGELHDPDRTPDAPCVKLRRAGWEVGATDAAHIQIVDVDQHPDLTRRYGVRALPTFVLIDDGKEVRRLEGGGVDQWDLAVLYKGYDERLAVRTADGQRTP